MSTRSLGRCYGWCRFSHHYAQLTTPTLPTIQRYTRIANARTGNTLRADFVGTQYKHSTVQSKPRAMDTHRGCSWCLSNGVGPRDSNRRCILCTSSVPARPRLLISDIYAGCLHIGPVSVRVPDRRIPCNRPRGGSWEKHGSCVIAAIRFDASFVSHVFRSVDSRLKIKDKSISSVSNRLSAVGFRLCHIRWSQVPFVLCLRLLSCLTRASRRMVVSGHIVGSVPRRLKSSLPSPSSLFSAFHQLLAQPARRKPTHTVIRACASRRQEVVTELGYHQRSAPLCAAGLVRHSGCVWPISAS